QFREIDPSDGTLLYTSPIGINIFDVDTQTEVNVFNDTWNFTQNKNPGITFQALAYTNPLIGTKEVDDNIIPARQLFAVGSRPSGHRIDQTTNLIFQLDPDSGKGLDGDYQSQRGGSSSVYQPQAHVPGSNPPVVLSAASGTDLIPRGQILTGVTILGAAAT